MASLLKSFGKGLLYILVLPVLLVILAVYAVLGVGMFVYVAVKGAILFFTGRNFGELPEDVKARAILEGTDDTHIEEVKEEEKKETFSNNDFASTYFVPLDSNIPSPAPKEEEKKDEGNE